MSLLPRACVLLFFSGFSALVYQTVWTRLFRLLFGASTAATAATLAVFMGGLGLGGWVLGRRVERAPNPLRLYGNLEVLVAVLAAASLGLLEPVAAAYRSTGGSEALGQSVATAVRLLLAVVVMGPCAVIMGATLPAAARAVTRPEDSARTGVAVLLGVNTLGAVTGVALTTFAMLEAFGTRDTLLMAALLNALVGLTARSWSRQVPEVPSSAPAQPPSAPEQASLPAPLPVVLGAAALVGFAFMLLELVWYRMLGPILGGSTYTFGLILAVALGGLGIGGATYAVLGRHRTPTLGALATTCAAEALAVMLPFAAGDRLALLAGLLRPLGLVGFPWLVGSWAVICTLVILPAAIIAGYQFPLLIALLGRGREGVGREVGLAYASNTFGSIAGSLAGGFGVLPVLGALTAWRGAASLLVLSAAAALLLSKAALRERLQTAALLAATLATFSAVGPTSFWRHAGVGAGRFNATSAQNWNSMVDRMRSVRGTTLQEFEGVESSVAIVDANGHAFVVNGKSDGHALADSGTQVMGGLLAAAMVDAPRRAMVIGLGTGSTAGWLAKLQTMERVDVAEIEPVILNVARDCADVNEHVLDNPKVKVHLEDARELLLTSGGRYDVIFSEPSNPYRTGIASLYTREFYVAVKDRLSEQGVMLQWLQAYEVDAETVRSVLVTLGSVFPYVEVWQTLPGDVVLRASQSPPQPRDAAVVRAALGEEPVARALRVAWGTTGLEGFVARFVAGDAVVRALMEQYPDAVNTDDLNTVEFAFARSVGRSVGNMIEQIRRAAMTLQADRPSWLVGEVDWGRVATERVPLGLEERPGAADVRALQTARLLASTGSAQAVITRWRAGQLQPTGLAQSLMLARMLADAGDEAALEVLRGAGPGLEAEEALARVRLRLAQRQVAAAVDELITALALVRTQVWVAPVLGLEQVIIAVASSLKRDQGALAVKLDQAFAQPLQTGRAEDERRRARRRLAPLLPDPAACVAAFEVDEPHTPWNRGYLTQRAACYERSGAPRAATAKLELVTFLEAEASPLLEQVSAPPEAEVTAPGTETAPAHDGGAD